MLVTAWGTANMRTGGDDIAQALALMGIKPTWDSANRRVTGFEVLPQGVLGRPRVDVTLRISGFLPRRPSRNSSPSSIARPAQCKRRLTSPRTLTPQPRAPNLAKTKPASSAPNPAPMVRACQAMIDEKLWADKADLGEAYLTWGSYAYDAKSQGRAAKAEFTQRLSQTEAIVQNQDNREHDILDSDDYYQFEGGAAAAISTIQGRDRPIYHNDHSRPERPRHSHARR